MNEKELTAFRAELRVNLNRAIVGNEHTGHGVPGQLPLDVIVAELGSLIAALVALNPSLQRPEDRRAAVQRLAVGIELQAENLAGLPNWPFTETVPRN